VNTTNWPVNLGAPTVTIVVILIAVIANAIRRLIPILLGLLAALAFAVLLLWNSTPAPGPPPKVGTPASAGPATPPGPAPPRIPPTLQVPAAAEVGFCTDGSGAVPRPLGIELLNRLADAVDGWPAGPSGDYRNGWPSQAGLHIVLRSVTDRSGRRDPRAAVDGYVDSVPGVPPRLEIDDPRFLDDEPSWAAAVRTAESARIRALRQAAETADAIRHLRLPTGSARVGECLATVAGDLRPGHRLLGSLSDLRQDVAGPLNGDLGNASILVGHNCAEADGCARKETDWTHRFSGHQAANIRLVEPEVFLDVLPDFMRGVYP
jgi:hypothetical protein